MWTGASRVGVGEPRVEQMAGHVVALDSPRNPDDEAQEEPDQRILVVPARSPGQRNVGKRMPRAGRASFLLLAAEGRGLRVPRFVTHLGARMHRRRPRARLSSDRR